MIEVQSNPYKASTHMEMGGGHLLWVGHLMGVRKELVQGLEEMSIYSNRNML